MKRAAKPFTVPDRTPLFKPMPRHYKGFRKLSIFCRANIDGIRKALPADLEVVSDVIEVFVMNCPEVHDLAEPVMGPRAYLEGGVVVPARYKSLIGGHVLYEYVTTDDAWPGQSPRSGPDRGRVHGRGSPIREAVASSSDSGEADPARGRQRFRCGPDHP
jgi:acetoacetate decarboxylase